MQLIIHITRYVESVSEGDQIFQSIMEKLALDDLIHVNAILNHNFKHPDRPDHDQKSNPYALAQLGATAETPAIISSCRLVGTNRQA